MEGKENFFSPIFPNFFPFFPKRPIFWKITKMALKWVKMVHSWLPGCQNDRIFIPERMKKVSAQLVEAYGCYEQKHDFCLCPTLGLIVERHIAEMIWVFGNHSVPSCWGASSKKFLEMRHFRLFLGQKTHFLPIFWDFDISPSQGYFFYQIFSL